MMKQLMQRFADNTARVENMVMLAGGVLSENASSDVTDFFCEVEVEEFEDCFGPIPEDIKEALACGDFCEIEGWLLENEKFGFLVEFATPEMKISKSNPQISSYSWSCWTTQWVYGDTLEAAMDKGFAWVDRQRTKEIDKAEGLNRTMKGGILEDCPKCGELFDPLFDQIVMCPVCGEEGSTACCNPGGAGVPCPDCEESES